MKGIFRLESYNNTTKIIAKEYGFLIKIEINAVINDANAKFKKNMLGVKISNIKNEIPHIARICQSAIFTTPQ